MFGGVLQVMHAAILCSGNISVLMRWFTLAESLLLGAMLRLPLQMKLS